jgi:hypothetical protein
LASIAISGAVPLNPQTNDPIAKTAPAPTESGAKAPADLKPDTVNLSVNAAMGASVPAVDGYPGITVARQIAATLITAATVGTSPAASATPPEMTGKR